ncbi:MAG: hypothetical protein AB8E82_06515 [Aureispira sp.]
MREKDNQEEFKNLAPKLKHLLDQEQQQASLPKNYFQNFEARLQQRIATEQCLEPTAIAPSKRTWNHWLQWLWKPFVALGVPALLVFFWLRPFEPNLPVQTDFLALSTQEIDQYIAQNLDEFSLGDLTTMAEPEVLDNWQEGILEEATPEPKSIIVPAPKPPHQTKQESSLDKALEATQSEDLLDELNTEDLNFEEDWF